MICNLGSRVVNNYLISSDLGCTTGASRAF